MITLLVFNTLFYSLNKSKKIYHKQSVNMPMAKQKSSAGLAIELDDGRKFYTFGSKVSGNVTLNTAQDFAIGSVSIEFYGRVKGTVSSSVCFAAQLR